MEGRPRSRRSFLVEVLARAAGLWVAVTGGLAALLAACDDGPGTGPEAKYGAPRPPDRSQAKLYGAPTPADPTPRPAPARDAPLYGAPPPGRDTPPRRDTPPPPPKYGAPVRRPKARPAPKPPEGS